jgi:DNA-3-methyladenine glycosylase I
MLILEGAQAGLSWITILRKRAAYRRAFDRFDARKIAKYGPAKKRALMADAGIVRNRLKIDATVTNARAFLDVQKNSAASMPISGSSSADVPRSIGPQRITKSPPGRPSRMR